MTSWIWRNCLSLQQGRTGISLTGWGSPIWKCHTLTRTPKATDCTNVQMSIPVDQYWVGWDKPKKEEDKAAVQHDAWIDDTKFKAIAASLNL